MRKILTLWKRELSACFLSPIAYVMLVVFLAVSGWVFLQGAHASVGKNETLETVLFSAIIIWLPILVTVVTMRLFAEENRLGTIETLMTAPVTEAEVVLGKYGGAMTFLFLVMLPAIASLFILAAVSPGVDEIDFGGLAGGLLILALLSASATAIGLVVSMTTRNQIVAAICIFSAVCLPVFLRPLMAVFPVSSEEILNYVSVETHIVDFARGLIDTRPVVFYVSVAGLALFAAVRVLEVRRWK